jgi:drug/metabolite transporter (DMT)-like permease
MYIVILIALSVFINAAGQICLKKATINIKLKLIYLTVGYSLFILSVLITKILIDNIDFKNMALIVTFNLIGVMIGSVLFLGESMTKRKLTGTVLVIIGSVIFLDSGFLK